MAREASGRSNCKDRLGCRVLLLPKGHGRHGCTESDYNYSGAGDGHLCNCEQPKPWDENKRPEALSLAAICALAPRGHARNTQTQTLVF
jgi:hypothetical protein